MSMLPARLSFELGFTRRLPVSRLKEAGGAVAEQCRLSLTQGKKGRQEDGIHPAHNHKAVTTVAAMPTLQCEGGA